MRGGEYRRLATDSNIVFSVRSTLRHELGVGRTETTSFVAELEVKQDAVIKADCREKNGSFMRNPD